MVEKFGWDKIIQSVMGALLLGAILAMFQMHSDLVALQATIQERQKNAVKVERLALVEAMALDNEKDISQLRDWLKRLSDRVNAR